MSAPQRWTFAYAYCEACERARCVVTASYDGDNRRTTFQHNDNPEAVMVMPDRDLLANDWSWYRDTIGDWLTRIHAYEDGGR